MSLPVAMRESSGENLIENTSESGILKDPSNRIDCLLDTFSILDKIMKRNLVIRLLF